MKATATIKLTLSMLCFAVAVGCTPRRSSAKAIVDGDLSSSDWMTLDGYLVQAEGNLSPVLLITAAGHLQQACDFFQD
jgi:hypothetical protein